MASDTRTPLGPTPNAPATGAGADDPAAAARLHVIFGPDGSRRFARERGVAYAAAYRMLSVKLVALTHWAFQSGRVSILTLWLLQHYNLQRPAAEVADLVALVHDVCEGVFGAPEVAEGTWSVRVIGDLSLFRTPDRSAAWPGPRSAGARTGGAQFQINILVDNDADAELAAALRRCRDDGVDISFRNLGDRWCIPPANLFIRTGQPGGFVNLSSFWPGIERGRCISTADYPQELTEQAFLDILNAYCDLKDSVAKLYGREGASRVSLVRRE